MAVGNHIVAGAGTTITRAVILNASKLSSYDEAKHQMHVAFGWSRTDVRTVMCGSFIAGLVVAVCTAPADFCRTRVMTAEQLAVQSGHKLMCVGLARETAIVAATAQHLST